MHMRRTTATQDTYALLLAVFYYELTTHYVTLMICFMFELELEINQPKIPDHRMDGAER